MAKYNDVIEGLKVLACYDPDGFQGDGVDMDLATLFVRLPDDTVVSESDWNRLKSLRWYAEEQEDGWRWVIGY